MTDVQLKAANFQWRMKNYETKKSTLTKFSKESQTAFSIILTKPLGIGIILAASMRNLVSEQNYQECIEIMQNTSSNVNLLIDVGHLNVSSNSLNFSREVFLKKCDDWIKAYHFSDNDGASDSNQPINNNSWFWPLIKTNLKYYSLEIYNHGPEVLKNQIDIATNKLK